MKLIASLTSPFARKVRILLMEKAFPFSLEVDIPWEADTRVPQSNPLGKIPVLVLDDGMTLYDSRVIAEYLDGLGGVLCIPEPFAARIAVRRLEALADGVSDAAAAIFLERRRPWAQISEGWIERQRLKVERGLAALSEALGGRVRLVGEEFTLADMALVSCLGYVALRLPDTDIPENLKRYAERLASRPSVRDTAPPAA